MKKFDQWWFPDEETQLPTAMARTNVRVEGHDGVERLTWQYHKYAAACALCDPHTHRRVAVDIGAHVGLWSYWMARDFNRVIAFEPNKALHPCFVRNLPFDIGFVDLIPDALGASEYTGRIDFAVQSTGGGRLVPTAAAPDTLVVMTLDSYRLPAINLLKIDIEGGEAAALRGGEQTIRRCKPVIVVEIRQQDTPDDLTAVHLLESWGAQQRTRLGNDVIMYWPGA